MIKMSVNPEESVTKNIEKANNSTRIILKPESKELEIIGADKEALLKIIEGWNSNINSIPNTSDLSDNVQEKRGFYQNGMWSFYGIVVGIVIGTIGNFWANVAYDTWVKHEDIGSIFPLWTGVLLIVVTMFVALAIYCLIKYKPWRLK